MSHYNLLFTQVWHICINKCGKDSLLAAGTVLDRTKEKSAVIKVDIPNFEIQEARIEVNRHPSGFTSNQFVPALEGVRAYVGSGKAIRDAVDRLDGGPWVELFMELVTALVQAEYTVADRRGFESDKAYLKYFYDTYRGSCIYYDQPFGTLTEWTEHVADQMRGECLYNRFKTYALHEMGGEYVILAQMMDSFHEVNLCIQINDLLDKTITNLVGSINRSPDSLCTKSVEALSRIIGLNLNPNNRREFINRAAGKDGCTHLADLLTGAANFLEQYHTVSDPKS